jgi:CheY-like chemotaxis protein
MSALVQVDRILWADDQPDVVCSFERLLQHFGAEVTFVNNAEEALEATRRTWF